MYKKKKPVHPRALKDESWRRSSRSISMPVWVWEGLKNLSDEHEIASSRLIADAMEVYVQRNTGMGGPQS